MVKLNQASVNRLGPGVAIPKYDRKRVGQGIVHIGVGGFHRAHQVVYTEDLFHQRGELEWGFCGVGLLEQDARMRDVLRGQDCLYTLVERDGQGDRARVVGSMVNYLFAPEERERVIEKMAGEETKIVSMTITEGGYYVQPGSGGFDAGHGDIRHDLEHPHEPRCAFGYILEALDRRRLRGMGPFTVMSCDNIQGNGKVTRKVVTGFAELRDAQLARWVEGNCAFPNSMVDRITPATTDEHREMVRERFGVEDGWPVMTETFKQWVIEDHFVQGRPAWEEVGAQMTSEVWRYEKMKLGLLNGSHQAICYIGMLLGMEYAHEAMGDGDIRRVMELLMDREVTPTLPEVPGVDLGEYKRSLVERFANPGIRDQLSRIGIYGSSGMPKFVLPSIEEQLKRGGEIELLCFVVACWFRYLNGVDEMGKEMVMKDPMAGRLREVARRGGKDPRGLLGVREVFGEGLAREARFVEGVGRLLGRFYEVGARKTLESVL